MTTNYAPPTGPDGAPDVERLKAEHRFIVEAVHASPMPFAIYDDHDVLIVWNPAYENLYQDAFNALRDKIDDRQASYEEIVRAVKRATLSGDELEDYVAERVVAQRRPGGEINERHYPESGWYRVSKSLTPSGAVVGIAIDINELKEREQAIEEAERQTGEERRRLENALEALEDGFAIYDADDRLRVFNSKFIEMHSKLADVLKAGESFEDMVRVGIERELWDLDDEDPEIWLQNLLQRRRENDTYESIAKFQDGRWMRRLETKTPDGERVGIRADITDAKMREFELEDARADAETATRAKSEFLANMSHEIRTPMNGVLGMAELLARTELDSKQQEFADIIMKSGNALLTIINDVLDFSKIDAGQLELDLQPVVLAEIVEDVATLVSATAAEREVELITRIDPRLPQMVVADGGRIRQILINIVGNAVKFTEQGHVYVEVDGPIYGEVAEITFKIQDTGIGIPTDSLDKIFESFNQVDASATRKFEGTGLGLAICSRLVDLMGGKIGVQSVYGEGSTFWFTVNLPVHGKSANFDETPDCLTGTRVLLVDDNEVNLSILKEQTASWGMSAEAVSSGPQAMMALWNGMESQAPFELLILDHHMPQMDGSMVAQCVRNDVRLSALKIIMLSSADGSAQSAALADLRLDGHLVKPARSAVLLETIAALFDEKSAPLPASAATTAAAPAAVTTLADLVSQTASQESDSAPSEAPDLSKPTFAAPPPPARTAERLDILVAEDNDINQIVFTQILQETPYNFKIVEDGALAVDCFRADSPRLILMDVSMPQMNGIDATLAIRQLEEAGSGHVPIVGVTANALRGDRDKCLDVGMDDYLAKPVSPALLKQKIEQWLNGSAEQWAPPADNGQRVAG